jgi:GGDEF domain-containing protein
VNWQAQLRSSDVLARVGGEEFAVLLKGCSIHDARARVEHLRRATPPGVTRSAGLVEREDGESGYALMDAPTPPFTPPSATAATNS